MHLHFLMIQCCKTASSYSRVCYIEKFNRKSIGICIKMVEVHLCLQDILQSGKRDLYSKI